MLCYLLPTTYYLLPTTHYLLPTLLPTTLTYYLLPTTYYLLPGDGTDVPRDYDYIKGGVPSDIAQLWATGMSREVRRREELRMVEAHYAASCRTYWSSFSDRRVDAVREELQEAAQASPNGFMAVAFKILRRTLPSACGNKARAPAPDLMCAIFEDGDDKDPSKLRTGADGFREELLKQGIEMYAARPSCGAAVDALLVRLEPVLRRLVREEAGEGPRARRPSRRRRRRRRWCGS